MPQRPFPRPPIHAASFSPISVYIHWPFCVSKCPYCDFNSHVRDSIDEQRYAAAYLQELQFYLPSLKARGVRSVFFGGGTPSLMPPSLAQNLLDLLRPAFILKEKTEVTLEANPSSVETAKLSDFRQAGVNRLSLGVQSLQDEQLSFLGRGHNSKEALEALNVARDIFENHYSFDLIYARPKQTTTEWKKELSYALNLAGDHLSLYQLTIETGTKFYKDVKKGAFSIPTPDEAADLYDLTQRICEDADMPRYEISNHARLGKESQHNLQYWRYGDYIGIGAGGCGRYIDAETHRVSAITRHEPEAWLRSVEDKGHGIQTYKHIAAEEAIAEIVLTGLRLKQGIKLQKIQQTGGDERKAKLLESANIPIKNGLLKLSEDGEYLRCTNRGFLLTDSLVRALT